MKWLEVVKSFCVRATAVPKNPLDLTLDEQAAAIEQCLDKDAIKKKSFEMAYVTGGDAEQKRLENQYPAGWFRLVGTRGNVELAHWCPKCKQLSQGTVAVHCSGQKREKRPEGWRLAFFMQRAQAKFV